MGWPDNDLFHDPAVDFIETPNGDFVRAPGNPSVWITETRNDDPAMALLKNPNVYSTPNQDIYKDNCYICLDPEFAQMGLPLCYPCAKCNGHVAADDIICDDCGADQQELWTEQNGG